MKLSWSYRITILYLGFVGIILTLVIICSRNKEELVAPDYYAQELKYQERIDAVNNANALTETVEHNVDEKQITLQMPLDLITKDLKGEISFFCPSDSKKDKQFVMTFNSEGKQLIQKNNLQKGIYKMRLSWMSSGKNYFKENTITIR
jgi:hypothetical protein